MSGRLLLDTNIVIAFLGNDRNVVESTGRADEVYVSATVAGELYYGAVNSGKVDENLERLIDFLDSISLLPCDAVTARLYGEIKCALRRKGKPIPNNDIWIASTAHQHSLTVVTRDTHFNEVDDLQTIHW